MSRSYKHFPISRMVLWGRSMKKGKQVANRKIRRKLKDPNIEVRPKRISKWSETVGEHYTIGV